MMSAHATLSTAARTAGLLLLAVATATPEAHTQAPQKAFDAAAHAREAALANNTKILLRIRGGDRALEAKIDELLRGGKLRRTLLYEYEVLSLPRDSVMTPMALRSIGRAPDEVERGLFVIAGIVLWSQRLPKAEEETLVDQRE